MARLESTVSLAMLARVNNIRERMLRIRERVQHFIFGRVTSVNEVLGPTLLIDLSHDKDTIGLSIIS